mgnify:CR=1 FL=1
MNYKNDVIEDFELGRGHVVALHMKETLPGKFREIPYGTGHVNLEAFAEKAWDMGVRKYVTEFWYTGSPDWKADLKDAKLEETIVLEGSIHSKVTVTYLKAKLSALNFLLEVEGQIIRATIFNRTYLKTKLDYAYD